MCFFPATNTELESDVEAATPFHWSEKEVMSLWLVNTRL